MGAEVRSTFLDFGGPDIEHGFGADDEAGTRVIGASAQPEEPGQALDGLAEAHVVREDTAETIGGEVGEKLETFDLIGAQGDAEACGQAGTDLEPQFGGEPGQVFPDFGVKDFAGGTPRQLEGVEAMPSVAGFERVEPEFFDGLPLGVAEGQLEASPTPVLQADELAPGGHELAEFGWGDPWFLGVDAEFEIKPVWLGIGRVEGKADRGLDGIFEEGRKRGIEQQTHRWRKGLGPGGEPFGKIPRDSDAEA